MPNPKIKAKEANMEKTDDELKLKDISKNVRIKIMDLLHEAKSGHSGGSLGMADVFTVLFFNTLKHDPEKPDWEERDHMILSNGHICPLLYVELAESGYIKEKELMTLRKMGTRLQGHPSRTDFNLIETSTGPLGQGICVAAGMAKGFKMQNRPNRIYISSSDGEMEEGSSWEAIMFMARHRLDNVTMFIDRNYLQIGGDTEEIIGLDPLADKLKAFNWNVIEADGHVYSQIIKAFEQAKNTKGKPTVIIFRTMMGKGVSFMENKAEWHGKAPNDEEYAQAIEELNR